jgi:hypothetical protein
MGAPYLPTMFAEERTTLPPLPEMPQRPRSDLPVLLGAWPGLMAGVYDVESTFALKGRGGHEANPLMRPAIDAGRLPTYGLLAAQTVGTGLLAKALHDRGSKLWWTPQALAAIGHLAAGMLNSRKMRTP